MRWLATLLVVLVSAGVWAVAGSAEGRDDVVGPGTLVSPTCVDSGGTTLGWFKSDKLNGCSGFCPGKIRCAIRLSMWPGDPGWVEGAALKKFCGCNLEGPHPCCHLVTETTLFINESGFVVYNESGFKLKADGSCPACSVTGVCQMVPTGPRTFQAACQ